MQLRAWRKEMGLSTAQGGIYLAVSAGYLNLVERGLIFPSADRIAHIGAATADRVTLADHWVAWGTANPQKFKASRAAGRLARKAYRKPTKRKG